MIWKKYVIYILLFNIARKQKKQISTFSVGEKKETKNSEERQNDSTFYCLEPK